MLLAFLREFFQFMAVFAWGSISPGQKQRPIAILIGGKSGCFMRKWLEWTGYCFHQLQESCQCTRLNCSEG